MERTFGENRFVQNADFVDMLWEWLSHWKSLFVCLLLGLSFLWVYDVCSDSFGDDEASINTVVTTESFAGLSESEKIAVENQVKVYKEYATILDELDSLEELPKIDKIEILESVANAGYYIQQTKKSMTEASAEYYDYLVGFETASKATSNPSSNRRYLVFAVLVIVIHGIVCLAKYISSDKVRLTSDICNALGCIELPKCIDWEFVNAKKGLDKLIAKARLSTSRRVSKHEIIKINANTIANKMVKSGKKALVLVCGDIQKEGEILRYEISKLEPSIDVMCVASLVYDFEGMLAANNADTVVILSKVNVSKVDEILEEKKVAFAREMQILATITYVC